MGTLMLDDILSVMNAGGIRTQRAYPGKPMPQVEETVAAVSLQKADLTTGETQIKVLVLSHSRMGAGACEDTAMAAARALKSAGYSCQVDSVEFDGENFVEGSALQYSNTFLALTNSAKMQLQEVVLDAYKLSLDPNYAPKQNQSQHDYPQHTQHQRNYYPNQYHQQYPEPRYPASQFGEAEYPEFLGGSDDMRPMGLY
jgi:hypothetical protein